MMRDFDEFIQERIAEDPTFADLLEESKAELELALALSAAREAKGLSLREVAQRAGMRPRTLLSYEKAGRTPKLTTLWRLAEALEVEIRLRPGRGFAIVPLDRPVAEQTTSEARVSA